eukprot:scaffold45509_cov69-Phaeocystis_antarctica.AAC.2
MRASLGRDRETVNRVHRVSESVKRYLRIRANFAHGTGSAAGERGEGPAARLELSGAICS